MQVVNICSDEQTMHNIVAIVSVQITSDLMMNI